MNALVRGAASLAACALILTAPAVAGPDDFTMPPGVSGAAVFDGPNSHAPYLTFVVNLHWDADATFFVRVRDSAGKVTAPLRYAQAKGSSAELPHQVLVSPPAKASEAWTEWEYVFVGPTVNPNAALPASAAWTTGNRVYGWDAGTYTTPAPLPKGAPATPSDIAIDAVTLTPNAPCAGLMHVVATVKVGPKGAAGWLQAVHADGSTGVLQEIRIAPYSAQVFPYIEDAPMPAATKVVEAEGKAVAHIRFRFYDRGPWAGKAADHLFPPPADGPWTMFGPWMKAYNPHGVAKPCH